MKDRKQTIKYIGIALVMLIAMGLIIFLVGRSFGFFQYMKKGETVNVIAINGIDVDILNNSENNLNLGNSYPMYDNEGLALSPFTFNIENTSRKALDISLKIENDTAKQSACTLEGTNDPCELLSTDYIKYSYSINDGPYTTPQTLGSVNGLIFSDTITGKQSIKVSIKLWIDSDAPNSIQGKYFFGQLVIEGTKNTMPRACALSSGSALTVGAKYSCNLGDSVQRTFYVLSVDSTNDAFNLIMDRNVVDDTTTMTYNDAIAYFASGDGLAIKNSWTKALSVDLPSAQDIALAGGITGWDYSTATGSNWSFFGVNSNTDPGNNVKAPYNWLYNYTRECGNYGCDSNTSLTISGAYGYWTKDLMSADSTKAWSVDRNGSLGYHGVDNSGDLGVRPVVKMVRAEFE